MPLEPPDPFPLDLLSVVSVLLSALYAARASVAVLYMLSIVSLLKESASTPFLDKYSLNSSMPPKEKLGLEANISFISDLKFLIHPSGAIFFKLLVPDPPPLPFVKLSV